MLLAKHFNKQQQATRHTDEVARKLRNHHYLFRISIILFFAVMAAWLWSELKGRDLLPIKHVLISGNYQHINPNSIKQVIQPFLKAGLLSINLSRLKQQLLQLPWLANVEIQRAWPDKIKIKLIEHKPIAVLNNQSLMDADGSIFTPKAGTLPNNLMQFNVPATYTKLILNLYRQMSNLLVPLGLKIMGVDLGDRMSLSLHLQNGMTLLLGRTDIIERLQRFVVVYPKVFADAAKKAKYIDLRYTNGMAIRWVR